MLQRECPMWATRERWDITKTLKLADAHFTKTGVTYMNFCMNMPWWNTLSRESIQKRKKSNGFNGTTKKEDSLRSQNLNAPTAGSITHWVNTAFLHRFKTSCERLLKLFCNLFVKRPYDKFCLQYCCGGASYKFAYFCLLRHIIIVIV